MFLTELEKYPGDTPVVSLYEEIDAAAFTLLLEYSPVSELKRALHILPHNRPDIYAIIDGIMMKKLGTACSASAGPVPVNS